MARSRQGPSDFKTSGSSKGVISSPPVSLEMAQTAVEFWTEAAMRDAEPYPLPEIEEAPGPGGAGRGSADGGRGAGGRLDGGPPEAPPEQAEAGEPLATTGGYDYPAPFTRFEVPDVLYQRYPWSTIGKV